MKLLVPPARLDFRRLRVALAALVLFAWLGAPACGSSKAGNAGGQACHQNTDCSAPYICALESCTTTCKTSRDCPDGGSCITDGKNAICQSAADKNTPCGKQADCHAPLACASDYHCRNLCDGDADCNVLGITGRVCAADANGVKYCADPGEVGPGDTLGGGGVSGGGAGGLSSSAGDGGSSGMNSDAGEGGAAGHVSEPAGGTGGRSVGGGSGTSGSAGAAPVPCVPICAQGKACVEGSCVLCGGSNQACCDQQTCGSNLSCNSAGVCECGGANEACCTGTACNSGLSCDTTNAAAPVCACGAIGTRCCPSASGGGATCSGSAVCAGTACSCFAQVAVTSYADGGSGYYHASALVRRVDGTIWQDGAYVGAYNDAGGTMTEVLRDNGMPLVASDMALTKTGSASHIGCAVVGGGVWCFPSNTLSDSTFLGAGLGASDTTSSPVQVVTAIGGDGLTDITQIDASSDQPTFCAVTSAGSIWCWGYGTNGQLGRGGTAHSSFARKVLTADGATPFAGAVEVRVGVETTCARKTDGSVWCWGTNSGGELGVSPDTLPQSYYPVLVPFTGSATRLGSGPTHTFCAVMQNTTVVCWGYDLDGQAGAPGVSRPSGYFSASVGPTTVLLASAGAPLTNVIDVAGPGYGANDGYNRPLYGRTCARTKDLDVLCWGAGSAYPTPFTDAANIAVSGVRYPLSGSGYSMGYVDPAGRVNFNGAPLSPQPPCTDLLK